MPINKYDNTLMKTAILWAEESHCTKKKVGAVLTKDGRPLNSGYNGTISKADNKCEHTEFVCNNCGNIVTNLLSYELVIIDFFDSKEIRIPCKKCNEVHFRKVYYIGDMAKMKFFDDSDMYNITTEENKTDHVDIKIVTSPFTIHAEANLILYATKCGIPTDGCSVYTTLSPCVECSKIMVVAGIKEVVYMDIYKDVSGLDYLIKCGVEVRQLKVNK